MWVFDGESELSANMVLCVSLSLLWEEVNRLQWDTTERRQNLLLIPESHTTGNVHISTLNTSGI